MQFVFASFDLPGKWMKNTMLFSYWIRIIFLKAFECSIKHISNQNLLMVFYFFEKYWKKKELKTRSGRSRSLPLVVWHFEGFNLLSMVAFEILFPTFWLIQKFCNCQKNYYLNIQFQGMRCQVSTRISKYSNLYRTYT